MTIRNKEKRKRNKKKKLTLKKVTKGTKSIYVFLLPFGSLHAFKSQLLQRTNVPLSTWPPGGQGLSARQSVRRKKGERTAGLNKW